MKKSQATLFCIFLKSNGWSRVVIPNWVTSLSTAALTRPRMRPQSLTTRIDNLSLKNGLILKNISRMKVPARSNISQIGFGFYHMAKLKLE